LPTALNPKDPIDPSASPLRPAEILFGRETESRIVRDLVENVATHGGALVLHGEPGVGKSALVQVAMRLAGESEMLVLKTSGVETEARMPFAGLHQLLRPVFARAEELPAVQRDALLAAFGAASEAPELFLVALATLNLLSDCAGEAPILLVAEDAHWLDAPTSDVLTFVGRRLESDPIILLAAIRDEAETAFAQSALPLIRLARLADEDAAALLDSQAPGLSPEVRERLLSDAAGNPLALIELPVAWQAQRQTGLSRTDWLPLTARLERAFASRARRLAAKTRTMLLVAALNDGESLGETLEATARLSDSETTLLDLGPAEAAGLIEVDNRGLMFRHPLIRSAVRQAGTARERHRAHAALADILADDLDRSVWHRAASVLGPDEVIARDLEIVAARAQRRGGASTAATALERAAELTPDRATRGVRLLSAAELAFEVGRYDVVARLLDEAELLALTAPDVRRMQWLQEFLRQGTGAGTVESLVAIADQMAQDGRIDLATNALQTASFNCFWFPGDDRPGQLVIAAVDRLPDSSEDPTLLAIRAHADPIGSGGLLLKSLSSFELDPERDHSAMRLIGTALTVVLSFREATDYLEAAVGALRAQGRTGLVAQTLVSLADAAFYSDDWDLALRSADECIRLAVEVRNPRWRAVSQLTKAKVEGMRGREETAAGLIAEAERTLEALSLAPLFCFLEQARAAVALGAGRYIDALEHLQKGFDPSDRAYTPIVALKSSADLVEAALHTDQPDEAVVVVDQLQQIADRNPTTFVLANVGFARALIADDDHAEKLFQAALTSQPGPPPFLQARLSLAFGQWLRRQQRLPEARVALRSARDAFDALGAAPWADRARHELRASGEKGRQRAAHERDALTSQEMQIAQMAAEGLTNREIGQQLFLSHRTVGSHLYRIFPKLGITSRSELTRRFGTGARP
jgi:DNA-binding CsgD family transcriptional regulator/tetratricopeptide (TPR) repeat protein